MNATNQLEDLLLKIPELSELLGKFPEILLKLATIPCDQKILIFSFLGIIITWKTGLLVKWSKFSIEKSKKEQKKFLDSINEMICEMKTKFETFQLNLKKLNYLGFDHLLFNIVWNIEKSVVEALSKLNSLIAIAGASVAVGLAIWATSPQIVAVGAIVIGGAMVLNHYNSSNLENAKKEVKKGGEIELVKVETIATLDRTINIGIGKILQIFINFEDFCKKKNIFVFG